MWNLERGSVYRTSRFGKMTDSPFLLSYRKNFEMILRNVRRATFPIVFHVSHFYWDPTFAEVATRHEHWALRLVGEKGQAPTLSAPDSDPSPESPEWNTRLTSPPREVEGGQKRWGTYPTDLQGSA